MYIAFITLWIVNGIILFQPYKKAVDACLWSTRQESNHSIVLAIGFELSSRPTMKVSKIKCEEAEEIDKTIKFGRKL